MYHASHCLPKKAMRLAKCNGSRKFARVERFEVVYPLAYPDGMHW